MHNGTENNVKDKELKWKNLFETGNWPVSLFEFLVPPDTNHQPIEVNYQRANLPPSRNKMVFKYQED